VAVRTDDIALRDLGEEALEATSTDQTRDRESLGYPVPMVEVHGTRVKTPPTVVARHSAHRVEKTGVLLRNPPLPNR
jgi:hypothetical protein